MYERKKLLPLRDAIILHLEPLSSRANPYTMPDSTCQEAMSERLSASRGNLSRVMNELKSDGYLEEMRAHVPMGNLRRKVYVLTEVGMREARELRWRTGETTIKLKDESGEIIEVRLREVPKDIRDGSSILDVALSVQRGMFDKQAYYENIRSVSRHVSKEDQRPRVLHFFGREKELGMIFDWFDSKKRVLEVKGVAGIGKTAMVATAFKELGKRTNTIWLSISDHTSTETIVEEIAAFLKLLGKAGLDTFLRSRREGEEKDAIRGIQDEARSDDQRSDHLRRRNEILYIMKKELTDQEVLLVIDGCEKAENEVVEFINLLLGVIEDSEKARIIVSGRDTSKIGNLKRLQREGSSASISLRKLDFESSKNILQLRGVERWRLEDAYKQTGGLPFFLELMGPSYESQAADIDGYLEEEVFGQLDRTEERTLGMISIFNEPVHSDAFFLFRGMKYGTIRSLVEKSLLIEVGPMVYEAHDILKQFTSERLKPGTRKTYHKKAAEYYLGLDDIEDVLRGASHLIEAGDRIRAGDVLARDGRRIIEKGHSRELYRLLLALESKKRLPSEPELSFLKAECLSIMGSWDEAIQEYDHSLLLSEEENELERVAASLRKIANIQMWRGNYEENLEPLERSAEISEKLGDLESLTDCYYSLAALTMKRDEFRESELYVKKCLETAKSSGNIRAITRAHKVLGTLKGELGEGEEALRVKLKAVKYAEQSGDLALLIDCYGNLANYYYGIKDYDEALRLGERSMESAKKLGDSRSIGWNLSNMASVYINKEEYDKANDCVDGAMEIFENLQDHLSMALTYNQLGYIHEGSDWAKAQKYFTQSLNLIGEHGNKADACEYYANVAHFYLWKGEKKKGMALMKEAEKFLIEIEEPSRREKLQKFIDEALEHAT